MTSSKYDIKYLFSKDEIRYLLQKMASNIFSKRYRQISFSKDDIKYLFSKDEIKYLLSKDGMKYLFQKITSNIFLKGWHQISFSKDDIKYLPQDNLTSNTKIQSSLHHILPKWLSTKNWFTNPTLDLSTRKINLKEGKPNETMTSFRI